MPAGAPLAEIAFTGRVIEWRGPAPFYFLELPNLATGEIRWAARQASYGWGVVPVTARIAGTAFTTSLFPRDDGYLLPLKDAVRRPLGCAPGDTLSGTLQIYPATAVRK